MIMARASGYARATAAVAACAIVISLLTSCQNQKVTGGSSVKYPPPPAAETSGSQSPPPNKTSAKQQKQKSKQAPVKYSTSDENEIKEVVDLAEKGDWDAAENRANALYAREPRDPAVQRLREWVRKRREQSRERAIEDRIRTLDARDSVFNPTLKSLATEKKDRGLPPRKDVRDAVQQIEATPYIPPTYGKTNILADTGLLFDFESRQGRMSKILDKEISVHLDDATLESIIFTIGQAEGINFVADKSLPAFQTKMSINMHRVKLSEFLRYVSRNLDLQFQVGDDLVWIVDAKDPKKVMEETRFYRLRKGFILPAQLGPSEVVRTETRAQNAVTVTEVQKVDRFVNDLAPPTPSIERAITNFFTGKYQIDYERNIIVARGTREQLDVLEQIIKEFDQPIQQVLIEARFITVTQGAFLRLGVIWGSKGGDLVVEAPADQLGMAKLPVSSAFTWNWTNVFGVPDLSAVLTALEQSGESQELSAPRLTVLNNLPATISDGKVQYYYEEYQVKTTILERRSSSQLVPAGKPTKITAGASLEVLASIGGDGKTVLLALNPKVNSDVQLTPFMTITDTDDTGKVVSKVDIRLPEYRTQDLATRVAVQSGQTVVMGGVLERQQNTYVESVPVLGNLPIIGPIFRRRTEIDRPRYLLIFVTATILSETGEYVIYTQEPSTQDRPTPRPDEQATPAQTP
ncbi:MAG TPA: type II secretion system protein GspD [Verrucomicrobiota bacterium]|nr:type II secretion system protein GspD [Verrucomicrobiota bacterium]